MKIIVSLLTAVFAVSGVIRAADVPAARAYRVVVELTSADPAVWSGVLNNIENLRRALGPETQVEVVAHGAGLGFLQATNTGQADRMKQLAHDGVVFAACRNTMKRQNVSAEQLQPFATTVDSGVAEVVRRQTEGWAYLRTGG
ncbi:hypothetical protein DB347_20515 [Opitutaceae bacterium EW11]|nr:hypothetical protein DB347_20515 [Opitutaceae bacterium EW11]